MRIRPVILEPEDYDLEYDAEGLSLAYKPSAEVKFREAGWPEHSNVRVIVRPLSRDRFMVFAEVEGN